jgi:hypothetical protein
VPPLSAFVDRDEWEGELVPACAPCNFKAGAQLGNRVKARNKALAAQETAALLGEVKSGTPLHQEGLSGPGTAKEAKPRARKPKTKPRGRTEPRLQTPVTGDGSLGPAVAAWYRGVTGRKLMDWQVLGLTGLLATDSGRLVHRTGLISTARQNGKSVGFVEALIGWWLVERPKTHGPQTVVLTSNKLTSSGLMWKRINALVERAGQPPAHVSNAFGRETTDMPDGSQLLLQAANADAGHSLSVDLVVADECWAVSEEAVDQGLGPTQRARPEPLMVLLSTAGTEASKLLKRHRDRGLWLIDQRRSSSFYMAEWSLPPGVDPMDESFWGWPNPALGTTITAEALRAEAEAPNRAAFLRGSMNLWISVESAWLAHGLWDRCVLEGEHETEPGGVLACEVSLDSSRYVGVLASRVPDGRSLVETAVAAETEPEFWVEIERLAAADPELRLAVTPSLEVHIPPALADRSLTVGFRELVKWTTLVRSAIAAGQVTHRAEALLSEHVARAVMSRTEGGFVLSTAKSPGPIELARCMVWAQALQARPVAKKSRPSIGIARRAS